MYNYLIFKNKKDISKFNKEKSAKKWKKYMYKKIII